MVRSLAKHDLFSTAYIVMFNISIFETTDRKPSRALMNAFNEYHVRHAGPSRTSEVTQISTSQQCVYDQAVGWINFMNFLRAEGESGIDVKPDICECDKFAYCIRRSES